MFTTWQQIEDWIKDNQFDHWIFSRSRMGDGEKWEKLIDSDYYADDYADKLAMTKKYLELAGTTVYGYGYRSKTGSKGATTCEARIDAYPAQTAGVGAAPQPTIDEAAIERRVREQIEAQMAKKRFEEDQKKLEQEKREFEKEKAGIWGLAIEYLSPIVAARQQAHRLSRVAGNLDAEAPVEADPIQPIHATEPADADPEQQDTEAPDFTDEEATEANELIVRFKKADPDYLVLLRRVVEMAEAGDATYTMAKGFLMQK